MFTQDKATPGNVLGRKVAGKRFTVIAETPRQSDGSSYVLAVREDGHEYVTWCAIPQDGEIVMFWGNYFNASDDSYEAFQRASQDLADRHTV